MTIRTKEDFYSQLTSNKFSKYLPIEAAFNLPMIIHNLNIKLVNKESCEKSLKHINEVLKYNKYYHVKGYVNKNKSGIHICEVEFCEDVRTYGEANSGIHGKDSIGIHFTDPDDDWNDWIWVAYDVLNDIAHKNYNYYLSNFKHLSDPDEPLGIRKSTKTDIVKKYNSIKKKSIISVIKSLFKKKQIGIFQNSINDAISDINHESNVSLFNAIKKLIKWWIINDGNCETYFSIQFSGRNEHYPF